MRSAVLASALVSSAWAANALLIGQDTRLSVSSTQTATVLEVRDLTERIGRSAKIPFVDPDDQPVGANALLIQSTLARRRIFVSWKDVPSGKALASLAATLGAEWRPVDQKWVLTDMPGLERLVLLSSGERIDARAPFGNPIKVLTEQQVKILKEGGVLRSRDLTPYQRWASQMHARLTYVGGGVGSETLRLENFAFTLSKPPPNPDPNNTGNGEEVNQMYRKLDGTWMVKSATPIGNIQVLAADPRTVPRLNVPKLREPEDLESKPIDLDADPILSQAVTLTGRDTVRVALLTIGKAPGVEFSVFTSLEGRRVIQSGTPITVRSTMQAIAKAAGGKWRKLGRVYLLQTPAELTRAGLLKPAFREALLQEAVLELRNRLSKSALSYLHERGRLLPQSLSETQRRLLIWATALAFAQDPEVAPAALDLSGTELCLTAREVENVTREGVELRVLGRDGKARSVVWVPLAG